MSIAIQPEARDNQRLLMPVNHAAAQRAYACGPVQSLPDTKVGAFTQALYDEANMEYSGTRSTDREEMVEIRNPKSETNLNPNISPRRH